MSGCVRIRLANVLALTLTLCASGVSSLSAQVDVESGSSKPTPAVSTESAPSTADRLRQDETSSNAGPDVYVLEDKEGKLFKLLGMSYEDFLTRDRNRGARRAEPEFAIDRFHAVGRVTADRAELDVQIDISLLTDRWVQVPLRLDGVIVLETPSYVGKGKARVVRNEEQELELWLRGNSEEKHAVKLKVLALLESKGLDSVGDRNRLRLLVPRATQSELVLAFPENDIKLKASDGIRVEVLEDKVSDGSRVRFRGLGGEVDIAWRNGGADVVAERLALDVEGRQLVEIHDWHIRLQADLKVSSRGRAFDNFEVVLPKGFQLISERHGRYRVAAQGDPDPVGGAQRVHVSLDRMTTGPFDVRIAAERSYEIDPGGNHISLAGFDVDGAVHQGGHIAILVDEGRRMSVAIQEHVGRVDDLPDELASDLVVTGFEYFRQPYQLEVSIAPPVASVSVEPQYTFDVSASEITLQGRMNYRVSGSNVHELAIDLAGWDVDLDAGVIVARVRVDEVTQDAEGQLRIPLSAGVKGDFEVDFTATRQIPMGTQLLRFPLPRSKSELRGVTTVIVLSADNVQLSPRRDDFVGLTPLRLPPVVSLPERQQKPFYYGTEEGGGEDGRSEFVSGFQLRDRVVDVEVDSLVNLSEGTVEQAFIYDVAFEPIESIRLMVPRQLLDDGRFKVQLEGEPLELVELKEPSPDDETVLVGTPLSEPLIGTFRLRILGLLPDFDVEGLGAALQGELDVPLAMPVEGTLARNELRLQGGDNFEFDLLDEEWIEVENSTSVITDEFDRRVRSKLPRSLVRLSVLRVERPTDTPVLVRKGWVRTWLKSQDRRDWASYRLRCRGSSLSVELPSGADTSSRSVKVYVDGQVAEWTVQEKDGASRPTLQIVMPAKAEQEYSLELQYSFSEFSHGSPQSIQTPRFGDGEAAAGVAGVADVEDVIYYELLVPGSEYLLGSPTGLMPVWKWQWQQFRWVRVPLMSVPELASWSGSPREASLHADTWTRYLFSSMSVGDGYQAALTSRSTATLVGAGGILTIGLALLYSPFLRRPATLLILAVILLAAGMLFPEPTLILAQAGVLGLILVLLSAVLKHLLRSRPVSLDEVLIAGGSSARLRTTEFHFAKAAQAASSQRTAITSPAISSFTHQEPASSES